MKFAVLALLGLVSAKDGERKHSAEDLGLSKEQWKGFGKMLAKNADTMMDLPRGTKARREFQRWVRGDSQKEHREMLKFIYSKGGPWEKFAGEDGHMTLDEARSFAAEFRKQAKDMAGIDMPDPTDQEWTDSYKLYDGLSDGEGFTKEDARLADKAIEHIRRKIAHWQPTDAQRKALRPIWKKELERIDSLDEDSKQYKFAMRWLNHRADDEMRKMNKEVLKEGGGFDKFSGDDHRMSLEEAHNMDNFFRKLAEKYSGEEIPGYSEEDFNNMYKAYDSLSEGEGVSKEDMMIGIGTINKFRDQRITEKEEDMYYPVAEEYYYDYIDDLKEDSKARKMWMDFVENGPTKEQREWVKAQWKEHDKDGNGALNRGEWRNMMKASRELEAKLLSEEERSDFSPGQNEFFWVMANAMKNGGWNDWGRHRRGVSKADYFRLMRILRADYKDILEDQEDSDEEEEEGDDELMLL